jgi:molybdenum cofactor synthesis domain-containing protein
MDEPSSPTAAVLVIGNEVLSGRTQDTNLAYIAKVLGTLGIDLAEARVVRDVEEEIVAAVNALRVRYTYVFTTGGIGPTHDDITADSIAKAFGARIDYHPEVLALLAARYKPGEFNEMRKRMARIPEGASLIKNSVSGAPGFQLGNVFVMAGVPMIMRAMLEDVAPRLARGTVVETATVTARIAEGRIAGPLAQVQIAHPGVAIGSYPFYGDDGPGVQSVVRGRDAEAVENAAQAIETALEREGAAWQRNLS